MNNNTIDQAYNQAYTKVAGAFNSVQTFTEGKCEAVASAVRPIAEKVAPYSKYLLFSLAGAFAPSTLLFLASSTVGAVVYKDKIVQTNKDFHESDFKEKLQAMDLHKIIIGAFVASSIALTAYSILPVTLAVLAKLAITTGVGMYAGALILDKPLPDYAIPANPHNDGAIQQSHVRDLDKNLVRSLYNSAARLIASAPIV